jgi:hypothetical protein
MTPDELDDLAAADEAEKAVRKSPLATLAEQVGTGEAPVFTPEQETAQEWRNTAAKSNIAQIGGDDDYAKGVKHVLGEEVGLLGDLGASLGSVRRVGGRAVGNTLLGSPPLSPEEKTAAKEDLWSPATRIGSWMGLNAPPKPGLAQKGIEESVEAIQGAFNPDASIGERAYMGAAGAGGLVAELATNPGGIFPAAGKLGWLTNPVEKAAGKIAPRVENAAGATFEALAGAMPASKPFTRRGVLDLTGTNPTEQDLAFKKVWDTAEQVLGIDVNAKTGVIRSASGGKLPPTVMQKLEDDFARMISPDNAAKYGDMPPEKLAEVLKAEAASLRSSDRAAIGSAKPLRSDEIKGMAEAELSDDFIDTFKPGKGPAATTLREAAELLEPAGTVRAPRGGLPEEVLAVRTNEVSGLAKTYQSDPSFTNEMEFLARYKKLPDEGVRRIHRELGLRLPQAKHKRIDEVNNWLETARNETPAGAGGNMAVADDLAAADLAEEAVKARPKPAASAAFDEFMQQYGGPSKAAGPADDIPVLEPLGLGPTEAPKPPTAQAPGGATSAGVEPPPSPTAPGGGGFIPPELKGPSSPTGPMMGPTELPIRERMRQFKLEQARMRNPDIEGLESGVGMEQADEWDFLGNPKIPKDTAPIKPTTVDDEFQAALFGSARRRRPAEVPEVPKEIGPADYASGLFKTQIDRVKSWRNSPAMQEMATVARSVIGEATTRAAGTLPDIIKPIHDMVDRRWWVQRMLSKHKPVEEVMSVVPSSRDPDLLYTKLTAAVDRNANQAVYGGRPAPPMKDPKAAAFEQAVRRAVADTGAAAEDAGVVRKTQNGIAPFQSAEDGGIIPHRVVHSIPWMAEGSDEANRFLGKLLKEPGNEAATADDWWQGMQKIMADPESEAGYEFIRQKFKTIPDKYRASDGGEWTINRAVNDFIPNPWTGSDLGTWTKREFNRAAFIRGYGQRGFEPGTVRDLIEGPNGLRARAAQEVAATGGDARRAQHDIDQLVSAMTGDEHLAGIFHLKKLGDPGFVDQIGATALGFKKALDLSMSAFKQGFQVFQEAGQAAPRLRDIPEAYGVAAWNIARSGAREALRQAKGLKGGPADLTAEKVLAEAGDYVGEAHKGLNALFSTIDSPLTMTPAPSAPAGFMGKLMHPIQTAKAAYRSIAGTSTRQLAETVASVPASITGGPFNALSRVNNEAMAFVQRWAADKTAKLAEAGELAEGAKIRMRTRNISPKVMQSLEGGPISHPDRMRLTQEMQSRGVAQTQLQTRRPEERQRIFNDPIGSLFATFQQYVAANGRFLENSINQIRTVKASPKLTSAEKTKEIASELARVGVRFMGVQAAGELERAVAGALGREESEFEKDNIAYRMLANAMYASFYGPLYLIADTLAYHGGVKRPYAERDGKETKPRDLVVPYGIDTINTAIENVAPAVTAPIRELAPDAVRENFDEEKDSATARMARAASKVPAVKAGETITLGEEEAKALRERPKAGRKRLVDELKDLGSRKRNSAVDELRKEGVREVKKRGSRETLDELLKQR